ncbi:uncharacterized protein LOC111271314 [Varroa jacobsoni]|uniref:G-protein coupled receptors family 1 profile domain-containing protein n=1 Tax=Varroa destructor TaxID=109461 RepID=A0A7M7J6F5_VARDE|nr:uncharacterized protein LOC111244547 isoform X1 [Varroa destructor]XP_022707777.1 uncharacterized protein LOC111271314 [Varroa jacobsoni]
MSGDGALLPTPITDSFHLLILDRHVAATAASATYNNYIANTSVSQRHNTIPPPSSSFSNVYGAIHSRTTSTFNVPYQSPYPQNALSNLVLYGILSVLGTTFNVFEISTLIVQECLRRRGNLLLANQALANLIITAGSFPVMCVAILAVMQDEKPVCHAQWFCALMSFFINIFNFLCIALENYVRSCRPEEMVEDGAELGDRRVLPIVATRPGEFRGVYRTLCAAPVVVILVFLGWALAAAACAVSFFVTQGLDICNNDMRQSRMLLTLAAPIAFSVFVFAKAVNEHRDFTIHLELRNCSATREQILQRRLLRTNFTAFLLFILCWLPFLMCVILKPSLKSSIRDNLFFVAQSYSCVCPLVYGATHDAFRQGFVYLIHYFCCKSHPEIPKPPVAPDDRQRAGAVRVGMRMVETRRTPPRGTKMSTMGLLSFAGGSEVNRMRYEEDFL